MVASIETARLVDSARTGRLFATLVGTGETDTTPPVVSNVSPVTGSTIDARDTIYERVTDDQALRGVVIIMKYANVWETAYEGRLVDGVWTGSFGPGYTGSDITAATGGYDFGFRRAGGWPGSFTLANRAFDTSGNANAA